MWYNINSDFGIYETFKISNCNADTKSFDEITEYNSGEFKLLINGVPDGENDYDFSIAKISCNPDF